MKEYRLDPERLAAHKRAAVIRILATIVAGSLIGLGLPLVLGGPPSNPAIWIVPIVIVGGLATYRLRKIDKHLAEQWRSFSVVLKDNELTIHDPVSGDYRVSRATLRTVAKKPGQGLILISEGSPPLLVPDLLANYAELEANILAWQPPAPAAEVEASIQSKNRSVSLAIYAMLGCWIASGFAPISVVPVLAVATIGLAFYVFRTFRALGVPPQFSRSIRWGFAFIVLGPIARLCFEALNGSI